MSKTTTGVSDADAKQLLSLVSTVGGGLLLFAHPSKAVKIWGLVFAVMGLVALSS
jgi:hypothetical protein